MMNTSNNLPVTALLGPTASGKTALALALAEKFPIEIISLDSALVYRHMDIGTAKPTAEERAAVPHHLIDIISPLESYNAAQFADDCKRLVGEIRNRGRFPVIVGGTMMYYRALTDGLSPLPPADAGIRQVMAEEKERYGALYLYEALNRADPAAAARLNPGDSQRVERALEVFRITGRPMSELLQVAPDPAGIPDLFTVTLAPSDRSVLHRNIERRFRQMLDNGFVAEVEGLRNNYPQLHADLPSMRCVGYRQAWEYLDGTVDFDDFVVRGIAATRQLAKRQLTWLRKIPADLILDSTMDAAGPVGALAAVIERNLADSN